MSHILTVAGSPCAGSKSTVLLGYCQCRLRRGGVCSHALSIRTLSPGPLLCAELSDSGIEDALALVSQAQGIVLATPVIHASFSGLLKAFLDLLPRDGLAGKAVLPILTGGPNSDRLAMDYALKPVIAALGARHILTGLFIAEAQIRFEHGGTLHMDAALEQNLNQSLNELVAASNRLASPSSVSDWEI